MLAAVMLLSLCPATVIAEENDISAVNLPKPVAPNYFVYTDGDETDCSHDDLRMYMVADKEIVDLTAEYDSHTDEFREKYGINYFDMSMQYDVSLDSKSDWQYTSEWDTYPYVGSYASGYMAEGIRNDMVEDFGFFWLTYYEGPDGSTYEPLKPAITSYTYHHSDWDEEIYSFDTANHSLNIRCRYIMQWETPDYETHYKTSEWSDIATFGKNSTQKIPDEPTSYEAPVISDLQVIYDEDMEWHYVHFVQQTPKSVWDADLYYMMNDYFEPLNLDSQVSINGGDWIDADVANSQWATKDGDRVVRFDGDDNVFLDTTIKLRTRFSGPAGQSPWSNVLVLNGVEVEYLPGDVNTNTIINLSDVSLLLKYIAKWDVEINFELSDVNDDGKINLSDASLILKHIAKWDVVLK